MVFSVEGYEIEYGWSTTTTHQTYPAPEIRPYYDQGLLTRGSLGGGQVDQPINECLWNCRESVVS